MVRRVGNDPTFLGLQPNANPSQLSSDIGGPYGIRTRGYAVTGHYVNR